MMVAGIIDMLGMDALCSHERALVILAEMDGDPQTVAEARKQMAPFSFLDLRVRFNGHRHPVLFAAEIEDELFQYLQSHREIEDCVLMIRSSTQFGIRRGDRSSWPILQKLVLQFEPFTLAEGTFQA